MNSPGLSPPRVFISYSHDSPKHVDFVLDLSNQLRLDGIDTILDQYEESPPEGWPRWMEYHIREADFVVMICTETYYQRVMGKEQPGRGHGVRWEGHLIYQFLYDAGTSNVRFIPLLPEPGHERFIPTPLRSATYYRVDSKEGYERLLQRLSGQPRVLRQSLGELRHVSTRERRQDFFMPWNVPAHNPYFTGREQILEELRHALSKESTVATTQPQVLSGLGGIGKTQIAIQYAYLNRSRYGAILWANAASNLTLTSSFAAFSKLLKLPESKGKDQEKIVAAVRRWLEHESNWLLILDNADRLELVKPFLPRHSNGHIVLTSRAQSFHTLGIARPIEIKEMLPENALMFLLKRIGREDTQSQEKSAAEALAEELGYLPLALEQAAAFIAVKQSRFVDYLKSFRKRRLGLLQRQGPQQGDYPESVLTTWTLNFQEVKRASAVSAELLSLCSFLSPDAIPIELFWKGGSKMGDLVSEALQGVEEDPVLLDDYLEPLTRYSLLRRDLDENTISIHRLIQEVSISMMDHDEQGARSNSIVKAMNEAFPEPSSYVRPETWTICERLVNHAKVGASLAETWELDQEACRLLFLKSGNYLKERARFTEAEPLLKLAIRLVEKAYGRNHPETIGFINALASLHESTGQYEQAQRLFYRLLSIAEDHFGSNGPETASTLNNLAFVYYRKGDHQQAVLLHKRALYIRERFLGPGHLDTAVSRNNLAMLYEDLGHYDLAVALHKQALSTAEHTFGVEHLLSAKSLNNLAASLYHQEKYDEAEVLFKQALEIRERTLGPEHPDVAQNLNNLALLYSKQGRNKEAEPLHKQALGIREKTLGSDHPLVANSLNNLAMVYTNQRRFEEAEQLFYRALEMVEHSFGSEHPNSIKTLINLAIMSDMWGKVVEAESFYERALRIMEASEEPNPFFVSTLERFARLLRNLNRISEAEALEDRAIAIRNVGGG